MAVNKKSIFKKEEIITADFAKAISHPARISILKVLAKRNSCICGKIVEVIPLAQSTVSQHLKELKKAGLVKGIIDGQKSCYCIDRKTFNEMIHLFNDLFGELSI
jgi:ArsR family transcriptional regulator, arsenate/arsenite/antimonite-responsive transcriptional repressor